METSINKADPSKWVEQYSNLMFQYLISRVNDEDVANDLIQETFLSALKAISGYRGDASEKNWLFSILKNKIIDYYRTKSSKDNLFSMPNLVEMDADYFDEEGHWIPDRAPKNWQFQENLVERKEIRKIIQWCRDHLKEVQKSVFTLKYMEELESDEICKVLNITPSNYWILVHRARLQMRSCIEKKIL